MKSKRLAITWIAFLAILLSTGSAIGQEPSSQSEAQTQGDLSVTARVNSRISYQGLLQEDGTPVSGSRDMVFRLFSNDACTNQVGGDIVRNGVQVSDGLFSVELDVSHEDVDGQGLWLEVEVGGTALGCQEILPTAYALSLRPGATIAESTNRVELNRHYQQTFPNAEYHAAVYAEADPVFSPLYNYYYGIQALGRDIGLLGESNSSSGKGVQGQATASSGTTYGVSGRSDSSSGTGVLGSATASTGETYGVYGSSTSHNGWGVYGEAPRYGVQGHATDTGGVPSIGVYGLSDSEVGGRGVVGEATATSGTVYGVVATSRSPDGAGVLAAGRYDGADLVLGGDTWYYTDGKISSDPFWPSSSIYLVSNHSVQIELDDNGDNQDADFSVVSGDDSLIFSVDDSGTTQVQVLHITGGSDLAEPFEIASAGSLVPGLAVAIDPEHPGQLRVADQAYDRTVAGCISGAQGLNPGLTLEQEGLTDGGLPVALSGRVYCWADASYGSIQPGDLLTTSDTPGHVMKVTNYSKAQGAIIGKAMSSLETGQGLILILVTLQ